MKIKWLGILVLMLYPVNAYAQSSVQVRRGMPMYFDHDEQSATITEYYQFCMDTITDATCQRIVDVVRLQGTVTFQYKLPNWVTNGPHNFMVRAFGEGEFSDPSNTYSATITGKPLPPTNLRNVGPSGSAPVNPTTGAPPSSPVIVRD